MRKTIFSKLSKSFVVMSISIILFMMALINISFNRAFESYLSQQNISQIEDLVGEIENLYGEGGFSNRDIASLNRLANRNKYDIRVMDSDRNLIVESTARNMMHRNHMGGMFRGDRSDYNVSEFKRGDIIVEIGYIGNYVFTNQEALFQRNIQIAVIAGGVLLILFSLIISYVVSNRLSYPIRAIKGVAEEIEIGNFSVRYLSKHSDPIEIYELSESINSMSSRLKYQEQLRSQLTSDMAHEIRTPLTILQGQVEAMICGVWELDKTNLESLYDELLRMNVMVDKLRDIHLLESKANLLKLEKVVLSEEIETVVKSLRPVFVEKNISIDLELEAGLTADADRDKFKQILYNLLMNAFKYSSESSKIVVNLYREDGMVIEVMDEGSGISKEDIKSIFERFYRGDKSRNKETGGLGLGLSIVKALVELHGWQILVESELGVGSAFKIKIPKKD